MSLGDATVTATSAADPSKSVAIAVRVVAPVVVAIAPTPTFVEVGGIRALSATVTGGTNNAGVVWKSSADSVIAVDANGTLQGVRLGSATITATSAGDPTKFASLVMTVVTPLTVSISSPNLAFRIRTSQTLRASVRGGPGDTTVTWRSSADSIVRVSATGVITAVGIGQATITARAAVDTGRSASTTVRVTAPAFRDSTIAGRVPGRNGDVVAHHLGGHSMLVRANPAAPSRVIATWRSPAGEAVTVWGDAQGRPERAVIGAIVLVFNNYRADTVDVAMISATGQIRVAWNARIPAPIYQVWKRNQLGLGGAVRSSMFASGGRSLTVDPDLVDSFTTGSTLLGVASCVAAGSAILTAPVSAPISLPVFFGTAASCSLTVVSIWNQLSGQDNSGLVESVGAVESLIGLGSCTQLKEADDCWGAIMGLLGTDTDKAIDYVTLRGTLLGDALKSLGPPSSGSSPVLVGIKEPCGCPKLLTGEARGYAAVVTGTSNTAVTWTSSNPSVLDVVLLRPSTSLLRTDHAVLTGSVSSAAYPTPSDHSLVAVVARGVGTATITARSVADPTRSATREQEVIAAGGAFVGITSAENGVVRVGERSRLYGYAANASTTAVTGWASTNPSVAMVSQDGVVTGLRAGETSISVRSVTSPSLVASYKLLVFEPRIRISNISTCRISAYAFGRHATLAAGEELNLPLTSAGVVGLLADGTGATDRCRYNVELLDNAGEWSTRPPAGGTVYGGANDYMTSGSIAAVPIYYVGRW